MQYLVIEIQTNDQGTANAIVTAFPEINQAEAKYHQVLSVAAISSVPMHTAALMRADGGLIESRCYNRISEIEGE